MSSPGPLRASHVYGHKVVSPFQSREFMPIAPPLPPGIEATLLIAGLEAKYTRTNEWVLFPKDQPDHPIDQFHESLPRTGVVAVGQDPNHWPVKRDEAQWWRNRIAAAVERL